MEHFLNHFYVRLSENTTLGTAHWYLNNNITLDEKGTRGWKTTSIPPFNTIALGRFSDTAVEGVFTCCIEGDINPSVSLVIYYPSKYNILVVYSHNGYDL